MRAPDGTAFTVQGPPGAPAVVLIHGLGLNRALWQWTAPALAHFRVVTYDLLGHGETPAIANPRLVDLTAQLAVLLDHLRISSAALVGFSMGGMVARHFAQTNRKRTSALVLLNTPHRRSPEAQAAVQARVQEARTHGPAATVEAALGRWFSDGYRQANPEKMDLVRHWVLANDPAVYPRSYRIFAEDLPQVLAPDPPLACPTLVMTGEEDHGNSPAMAISIAAEIAGARVTILPGLRHMALMEAPQAVNIPLLAFLADTH